MNAPHERYQLLNWPAIEYPHDRRTASRTAESTAEPTAESTAEPTAETTAETTAAFLRRLEHEVDGAVEVAVLRQVLGGSEQHRGVAVVAAGVHLAGVMARMREVVVLAHRQRVDVGAQPDGAIAAAILDDADDARRPEAAVDRDAPVGERLGDHVRRALLLEAQLGMRMDVASHRRDRGSVGEDGFDQVHTRIPAAAAVGGSV